MMRPEWLGAAGKALAGLALIWFLVRFFEWKSLYFPMRGMAADPAAAGLEFEDVDFVAEDGVRLHGWWIPHPAARGTILHCHGNAGNISHRVGLARDLHELGVNVFLFDYRGYGRSRGLPGEQGTYRDARAAYEVVRARYQDAEQPPIIVHGQSLGAAVAIQLALDKPVRGLMIESAFASVPDMAAELYPWLPRGLIRYRYDNLGKIGRLAMPKLMAHGPADEIVPFRQGQLLYDRAARPKEFVRILGGHNDGGWHTTPEYWRAVSRFVEQVLGPARPSPTPAPAPRCVK